MGLGVSYDWPKLVPWGTKKNQQMGAEEET